MWSKIANRSLLTFATKQQVLYCLQVISRRSKTSCVGVLSAPFNKGQRRPGVKDGPTAIKETGVLTRLQEMGVVIKDYGEVPMDDKKAAPMSPTKGGGADVPLGPDGERNHTAVLTYNRKLASSVATVVKEGGLCLTLGGDHSIAIGTINGHAQANPDHQVVVLWVDAHADINTGASSLSGNMHGMPVSHHLREVKDKINRLPDKWPEPSISANHIAYIGLRDLDDAERVLLKDLGILAYDMRQVDKVGIEEVIRHCLEVLQPSGTRPLHVSFDIDSLDPAEAPSTGTPVRAGLTLREGLKIVEAARDTGFLKAFDLVEVNPELGLKGDALLTTEAAKAVLLAALAGRRGT
ncbi:arginase, hepatic-like [Macrobrachium rosenbergii]|uniref:arginase, hepatic-like n=1 Tax=Macrobrachium rosenbergii TaxID=79674 RepID=UPI0034D5EB5F